MMRKKLNSIRKVRMQGTNKIVTMFVFSILMCAVISVSGCSGENDKSDKSDVPEKTEAVQMSYKQISQEEAKKLMDTERDYIILDVRTQEEFNAGHINGAICIPNETIYDTEPAELPDKNQLILVYCRSGNRSKQASQKLADMGYTNIQEFGGIITWKY